MANTLELLHDYLDGRRDGITDFVEWASNHSHYRNIFEAYKEAYDRTVNIYRPVSNEQQFIIHKDGIVRCRCHGKKIECNSRYFTGFNYCPCCGIRINWIIDN